jgi:hypothetical protein
MDYRKSQTKRVWGHLVTGPFIWLPLIPFIFLDILIEIYHHICFPLYGITKVKRSAYIRIIDRNKLRYLNPLEKIGCMYCGYVNGGLLYMKEIAGLTEKYWCGIMHENKPGFIAHDDQIKQDFAKFGDEADFKSKYPVK